MRLNIGAGDHPLDRFENLDLPGFDMTRLPWAFPTESVEMIVMSHVLEHVTRDEGMQVIRETKRVLSPGGRIHIAVPDMDKFIKAVLEDDHNTLSQFPYWSLDCLLGGGKAERRSEMRHRYMYSFGSLWYTLNKCGFHDIEQIAHGELDTPTTRGWSMQVEASA